MKPAQFNLNTDDVPLPQHKSMFLHQLLSKFKLYFIEGWFVLGNVLLLMGGDDSVEIKFRPNAIHLLNQSSIPFSGNYDEGQRS
jgi:hypothetical protein